ncbi:hypothetical protein ACFLT1_00415 [Bacteroidota bacterium]
MNSPFKFLDAYTKADHAIFFGRDREIEELYHKVFENKILLIYGVSGTGKTSLINCGLGNKFEDSDWLPVNVRRGTGIVEALWNQLKQYDISLQGNEQRATGNEETPSHRHTVAPSSDQAKGIVKLLQSVYLDHFKPIYLIFDQFEELFIFGSREERDEFLQVVRAILDSDVQCKVLISLRAEYLAEITDFEIVLPNIMQNRMRVEKMRRSQAKEAVEGPCKVNNIALEEGFTDALLKKLNPEGRAVELTYLQVFLDRLYRSSKDTQQFSISQLDAVGDVSDLLGSFLDEQIREMEDPDMAMSVLKAFVSMQGTRKKVVEEEISNFLESFGKQISHEALVEMLQKFVNLRVLQEKDDDGRYELRHDSLAQKIYEKITLVEKEMLEVRQFLETALNNYRKRGIFLTMQDLKYIAPYRDKLYVTREMDSFIEGSKKYIERARKRMRRLVVAGLAILFLILGGFTAWALKERNKAITQSEYAEEQKKEAERSRNEALFQKSLTDSAFVLAQQQRNLAELSRNEALFQKSLTDSALIIAENQRVEAENAKNEALFQKNLTDSALFVVEKEKRISEERLRKVRASNLTYYAEELVKDDPTHAIRILEQAKKLDPSNDFIDKNLLITYHSENFYKTLYKSHWKITSIDITEKGDQFAIGLEDGSIRIFNINGNEIRSYSGNNSKVLSILYAKDDDLLISISEDSTICFWDLTSEEKLVNKSKTSSFNAISLNYNENILITCTQGNDVALWDLDGNQILQKHLEVALVQDIDCHPFKNEYLVALRDGTIGILDNELNLLENILVKQNNLIFSAKYSKNGEAIVSGCSDGRIYINDNSDRIGRIYTRTIENLAPKNYVEFSADGNMVAVCSQNSNVYLFGFSDNDYLNSIASTIEQNFNGHEKQINQVSFSPDNDFMLTVSDDGSVKYWTLNYTPKNIFNTQYPGFRASSLSDDDRYLICGHMDSRAVLMDLVDGSSIPLIGHNSGICMVEISDDGKQFLTGSIDGEVILWDKTGKILQRINAHRGEIRRSCFFNESKNFATSSLDSTVKFWNIDGELIDSINFGAEVTSIFYLPNGQGYLISTYDINFWLYDSNGEKKVEFIGHNSGINGFDFSQNTNEILSVASDNTSRIWDLYGNELADCKGHTSYLLSGKFLFDGSRIITSASDGFVKIWGQKGEELYTLLSFPGRGSGYSTFSSSGDFILTSSFGYNYGGFVIIWRNKPSYFDFQKSGFYDELSVNYLLEEDLVLFQDILTSQDGDLLIQACYYYLNQLNNETQTEISSEILDNISELIKQLKNLEGSNSIIQTELEFFIDQTKEYYNNNGLLVD